MRRHLENGGRVVPLTYYRKLNEISLKKMSDEDFRNARLIVAAMLASSGLIRFYKKSNKRYLSEALEHAELLIKLNQKRKLPKS